MTHIKVREYSGASFTYYSLCDNFMMFSDLGKNTSETKFSSEVTRIYVMKVAYFEHYNVTFYIQANSK